MENRGHNLFYLCFIRRFIFRSWNDRNSWKTWGYFSPARCFYDSSLRRIFSIYNDKRRFTCFNISGNSWGYYRLEFLFSKTNRHSHFVKDLEYLDFMSSTSRHYSRFTSKINKISRTAYGYPYDNSRRYKEVSFNSCWWTWSLCFRCK